MYIYTDKVWDVITSHSRYIYIILFAMRIYTKWTIFSTKMLSVPIGDLRPSKHNTSSTFVQHCTNAIQMFCFHWGVKAHLKKTSLFVTDTFCKKRSEGTYGDPRDCTQYILCSAGNAYLGSCAPGLVFSPVVKACDYDLDGQCSRRNSKCVANVGSMLGQHWSQRRLVKLGNYNFHT